jgi:hypothetical protein
MEAESENITYQQNIWYGIHGDPEDIPVVIKALTGTKYAGLIADDHELTIDGAQYLRNFNSDLNESRYIIFADDMSVQGEDSKTPASFCKFDPTELASFEEKYAKQVEVLTEIYDLIVAQYKRSKVKVNRIYFGWQVYNCEWDGDNVSE